MTDINEENKDLIENLIPFEFLNEGTQKRMENWSHGFKGWDTMKQKWVTVTKPARPYAVYRAKPAPERRECFVNVYPDYTAVHGDIITALHDIDPDTLCRWKIAFDADGSNPTIEVIKGE